jgi:5-methylcytosine-specific restriction enzyme A
MANTSWSGQRRAFPTRMRTAILRLYPVCCACGRARSTVADHIISHADCIRAGINPDTISNGQGLCGTCHDVKTKAEARAGRARQPRAKRPPEKHPGLL